MNIDPLENTGERMVPELTHLNIFWEHIYRYRFALPYVKDKRVLDIACGEGYGTSALQMAGAKKVIGVDISPEACIHAHKKYGVDSQVGSAEEIPLGSDSVDVVVSFETIEHLEKPLFFLREIQRVLSKKGVLIISTPIKGTYYSGGQNEFHKNEFTKFEFFNILNEYYSSIKLFGQVPIAGHIYSRNAFCSQNIPTTDLPVFCIMEELRKKILKGIYRNPLKKREHANLTILEEDDFLSKLFNPFVVRPVIRSEDNFIFNIAVVSK